MGNPVVVTTPEQRAACIISPFGDGSANTNVDMITLSTTAAAYTIPSDWYGCLCVLKAIGADAYYFFSEQTSVKPDASKTSRDPQLGWRLRDGEVVTEQIPRPSTSSAAVYLLWDGSGAGQLWIKKASTP